MLGGMIATQLWRYPVKSMAGERLEVAELERRGIVGDRLWAVRDDDKHTLTSAKKLPALLRLRARFLDEPQPRQAPARVPPVAIGFPNGDEISSSDPSVHRRLSDLVEHPVSLVPLRPTRELGHFRALQADKAELRRVFGLEPGEPLPDLSMLPLGFLALLSAFATPPGSYFDVYPLHLLTTSSLAALRAAAPDVSFDPQRFRPNVLLHTDGEGFLEHGWVASTLSLGSARARVECVTPRCSMPARPQLDLPADARVMKVIARETERTLGVYASIPRGGRIRVGQTVTLGQRREGALARTLGQLRTGTKRRLLKLFERLLPEG